jgi:hypothetical protein
LQHPAANLPQETLKGSYAETRTAGSATPGMPCLKAARYRDRLCIMDAVDGSRHKAAGQG